jgi:hypothetical protein
MGNMIPYYQTLEKGQKPDHIVVRFDNFDHNVLIDDYYCDNPECHCMAVNLSFIMLQDDVKKARGIFSIRLDMRSWEITEREIYDKKIKVNEMIAEFVDNLDEFKETFKSHYRAVKQYGRGKYKTDRQPDVIYYDISGNIDDNPLAFQYAGTKYVIADQYCTDPECPCTHVTLNFIRLNKLKLKTSEFTVNLYLDDLSYEVVRSSYDPEKISDIMKYILRKQDVLETLKYRFKEMKKDGGESHRNRTEVQKDKYDNKIGRNDPCPCGSGKKYKKCCGQFS